MPQSISNRYEMRFPDMQPIGETDRELVARLSGTACHFCEEGSLVAGEYKGNEALVCTTCGTPAVQLW